jgi:hypothetical protein
MLSLRAIASGCLLAWTGPLFAQQSSQNASDGPPAAAEHAADNSAELTEFTPPVEIVDANEFLDGGTTYVKLRDAKGRIVLLCLSQRFFEATIPNNTLFIDASHPEEPTARLPLSESEAQLVLASLKAAVTAALPKEELEALERWGDPAEHRLAESAGAPADRRQSEEQWRAIFAFDVLRRLEARESIDVLPANSGAQPQWYEEYIAEVRERRAEEERERQEDELFKSFYPAEARSLFRVRSASSDNFEELEAKQGKRIAEVVGDPVTLAVITSRALGTCSDDWRRLNGRERIALHAVKSVSADAFAASLEGISDDQAALLGAARLYFSEDLGESLPEEKRLPWALKLAESVLNSSLDDQKPFAILDLNEFKNQAVDEFLTKIAEGEVGKEVAKKEDAWNDEPGIRATAYLALASRGNRNFEDVAKSLMLKSTEGDKAAYELSLALLGDSSYIKAEHFAVNSYVVGFAAIQAIERCQDAHALDILFSAGFEHSWAAVKNESVRAAQRITGHQWTQEGNRVQDRAYADDARRWWKENRDAFLKERAAKRPSP